MPTQYLWAIPRKRLIAIPIPKRIRLCRQTIFLPIRSSVRSRVKTLHASPATSHNVRITNRSIAAPGVLKLTTRMILWYATAWLTEPNNQIQEKRKTTADAVVFLRLLGPKTLCRGMVWRCLALMSVLFLPSVCMGLYVVCMVCLCRHEAANFVRMFVWYPPLSISPCESGLGARV